MEYESQLQQNYAIEVGERIKNLLIAMCLEDRSQDWIVQ